MSKNKIYAKLAFTSAVLAVGVFGFAYASAQTSNVTFPISELGGCANAKECKTYCNDLANVEACTTYGEAHGLLSSEKAEGNRKLKKITEGPGGCDTKDACKAYC